MNNDALIDVPIMKSQKSCVLIKFMAFH